MFTQKLQDCLDYSDVVLLASIEVPRKITDPEDLQSLHLLASQDLISFGSTIAGEVSGQESLYYTIPTAKLTKHGKVMLNYMRAKMNRRENKCLQKAANVKMLGPKEALEAAFS